MMRNLKLASLLSLALISALPAFAQQGGGGGGGTGGGGGGTVTSITTSSPLTGCSSPCTATATLGLTSPLPASNGGTGISNTATLTLGTSNQNWATLGTGIVKNTTTTGALSDAASSDVIGLWTGSCSSSTYLNGAGVCTTPSGTAPALSAVTGSAAQATGTEVAAGDNYTFAGIETTALVAPFVLQNTNSTNNNASVAAIFNAAGTGTGGIAADFNTVSGTGNIVNFYAGATVTNGTLSGGTLEAAITASGALILGTGACTVGSALAICFGEGSAPTAAASYDQIYADSTNHQLEASQNNFANAAAVKFFPLEVDAINTQTASYSVVAQDSSVLCNKATAMTITLISSGIPSGKTYHIKNIGVGTCTVSGVAIDGYASGTGVSLGQYQAITLKFDGVQFWLF